MTPDIGIFLKGAFVGASVAAPIGPVAIFCIRQTLAYGWKMGIIAGLGTAIADGIYGAIAALGAHFISDLLASYGHWFYLVGGSFLIYIGQKIMRTAISKEGRKPRGKSAYAKTFLSVFLLNFASPMTTLLFVGMFATVGVFDQPEGVNVFWPLTFGVGMGAFAWWGVLTAVVSYLSSRLNFKVFTFINRVSGLAITIFGLLTLLRFFK